MGYDRDGRCPMLKKEGCLIYQYRPETCRTFDCRILAAAGLTSAEKHNPVFQQAKRWKFTFPAQKDREEFAAVQRAAGFFQSHPNLFGDAVSQMDAIRMSVAAVKVYDQFVDSDGKRATTQEVRRTFEEFEHVQSRKK